jgi:superfamily II DNA or RNA helicase
MGRVMRTHDGKDFALWLDHSGNYLRFRSDWDDLYIDKIEKLDETVEKTKKEPTEDEKTASKCPKCGHL